MKWGVQNTYKKIKAAKNKHLDSVAKSKAKTTAASIAAGAIHGRNIYKIANGIMPKRYARQLGIALGATQGLVTYGTLKNRRERNLQHSGVKGMKWGVRKAKGYIQNKINLFKTDRATKRDNANAYKNRANLSDAELRARTQRLRLENDYKQAIQNSKNQNSIGREIIRAAMPVIISAATAGATHYAVARISNSSAGKRAMNGIAKRTKLTKEQIAKVFSAMGKAAEIKSMPKKKQ